MTRSAISRDSNLSWSVTDYILGTEIIPGKANFFADAGWDITADLGGDGMERDEVLSEILTRVSQCSEANTKSHTDSFQSMGTPVQ